MRVAVSARDGAGSKLDVYALEDGRYQLALLRDRRTSLSAPTTESLFTILERLRHSGWRVVKEETSATPNEQAEQARARWHDGIAKEMPRKDADAWLRGIPRGED